MAATQTVTYSTTPPANPNDGDQWILPADPTNGIMWLFRYRAAAGTYKWEYIGGPPLTNELGGSVNENVPVGGYVDLATPGPQLTLARAGDYLLHWSAFVILGNTATCGVYLVPKIGAAAPVDADSQGFGTAPSIGAQTTRQIIRNVPTPNSLIKVQYYAVQTAGTVNNRVLQATPVRVT